MTETKSTRLLTAAAILSARVAAMQAANRVRFQSDRMEQYPTASFCEALDTFESEKEKIEDADKELIHVEYYLPEYEG